jgi:hypothetical protein
MLDRYFMSPLRGWLGVAFGAGAGDSLADGHIRIYSGGAGEYGLRPNA